MLIIMYIAYTLPWVIEIITNNIEICHHMISNTVTYYKNYLKDRILYDSYNLSDKTIADLTITSVVILYLIYFRILTNILNRG